MFQRHETLARYMQELHPGITPSHLFDTRLKEWVVSRDTLVALLARDAALSRVAFDSKRFVSACEPGANVRART